MIISRKLEEKETIKAEIGDIIITTKKKWLLVSNGSNEYMYIDIDNNRTDGFDYMKTLKTLMIGYDMSSSSGTITEIIKAKDIRLDI